jgi:hypothetical protein
MGQVRLIVTELETRATVHDHRIEQVITGPVVCRTENLSLRAMVNNQDDGTDSFHRTPPG